MKKFLKQIWALISDKDWDADPVKVFGLFLMLAGVAGWWLGKPDFQWIVITGAGMVSTGKFSAQG